MKERKGLRLSLYILAFMIIATGISYAFFSTLFLGEKEYSIAVDQIIFRYTEVSQGITLNEPSVLTDEEGKASVTYFDFDVYGYNVSDVPYLVYIEVDPQNTLNPDDIKIYLTDQNDNEVMAPKSFSDLKIYEEKENCYKLYRESIVTSGEVDSYRIRIWLSQASDNYNKTDNSQMVSLGGNFKFKVNVITPPPVDIDDPVCTFEGPADEVIYSVYSTTYLLTCTDDDAIKTTASEVQNGLIATTGLNINSVTRTGNPKKYQYEITVQGTTPGDKNLTLQDGIVTDIANNSNTQITSSNVTILVDDVVPLIDLAGAPSSTLINSTSNVVIPIKIIETEGMDPSLFTIEDISVLVGENPMPLVSKSLTYNGVTNGIYSYSLTLTNVTGNGNLTLSVREGSVEDVAGGINVLTLLNPGIVVDNIAPTCLLASTGNYEESQTLTLTSQATDLNNNPYSFTSATSGFSTNNLKTGITKTGVYIAYVKDTTGNVGSCSYTIEKQTEYRYRNCLSCDSCSAAGCAEYYWAYGYSGCSCSSSAHLCQTPYAIQSYAGCNVACCTNRYTYNTSCRYNYTSCSSCGCLSWGGWSNWSTTVVGETSEKDVETRVTYR